MTHRGIHEPLRNQPGSGQAARVWPPYEEEVRRDTAQGSDGFIAL